MTADIDAIRHAIIDAALPSVPFDGWTVAVLEDAAQAAGFERATVRAVFPDGLSEALACYAAMIDDRMLAVLSGIDPESLRVRDRIHTAVMARFSVLQAHKEAEKRAISYWSTPLRSVTGSKLLWRTADRIWDWAGDTATDYNRYTKRALLSGVLGTTALTWLNDDTPALADTAAFLARRIENVMTVGRFVGRFKKTG